MSARVRLRALASGDLALFRALYCHAGTMCHIGRPLERSRAASSLRATIDATRTRAGPRFFVIEERGRKRPAGLCSSRAASDPRHREIGIMLLRSARGRGLAGKALGMLIARAFERLPITAVSVQYRNANAAMSRLCDRLGFPPAVPRRPGETGLRVRVLRRSRWQRRFQPSTKGKA